jgi:hypothetical protein
MIDSLEPDSNIKVERFLQSAKQWSPTVSTDEGMQIDRSDEQLEKVDTPRDDSLQSDSKVRCESFPQSMKQDFEIVSTDEGMQID